MLLLILGGSAAAEQAVTLAVKTERDWAPDVVHTLEAEVQRVLSPAGVRIQWVPYEEALGRVFSHVVVVQLVGRCDTSGEATPDYRSRVLGAVHITDGEILPYVDVYCDHVVAALPVESQRHGFLGSLRSLGRALGRVLAHELFHVLAQTRSHGYDGLAKPVLSGVELIQPSGRFETSELELIRRALTPRVKRVPGLAAAPGGDRVRRGDRFTGREVLPGAAAQ